MEMNCKIIQDLLPLYIDGVLSQDSIKLVEEHLENCEECKEFVETLKKQVCDIKQVKEKEKGINFFKRLRKTKRKTIVITSIITVVIVFFSVIGYAYCISGSWKSVDSLFFIEPLELINKEEHLNDLKDLIVAREEWNKQDITLGKLSSGYGWGSTGDFGGEYMFYIPLKYNGETKWVVMYVAEPFFATLKVVNYEFAVENKTTGMWDYSTGSMSLLAEFNE